MQCKCTRDLAANPAVAVEATAVETEAAMVPLLLLPDTTATAATHAASCSPAELVRIHVLHPMSSPGFRRIRTLTQNTVRYDGHTFSEVGRGGHIKHTSPGGSSRGVLGSSIDAVAAALGVTASHDQVLRHEHSRSEVYHNERYQKLLDSFNRLSDALATNRGAFDHVSEQLAKRYP